MVSPSIHMVAHVVATVLLTCLAYHYLQLKSQQSMNTPDVSKDKQTQTRATNSVSTHGYPKHVIFDNVKSSENPATLLKPSPVATSYKVPPMPFENIPSPDSEVLTSKVMSVCDSVGKNYENTIIGSVQDSLVEGSMASKTPALDESLATVSTTVTSMTVQEVHPQFNWGGGGGPGPGQCGGPGPGCGGDQCGGGGGCGCGGGCGGPAPGCGGGGPPPGQCGGPGPGNPGQGQCGGFGQGLFGGQGLPPGGDPNMMPSESFRPPSSTEFTTSAAASLRTELRTDPDELAMPGEGIQPLSNDIVTKVGENPHGDLYEKGTSVWCTGTNHTNRLCHFRNLCYISAFDDFVFFHSEHSTIYGVPENRFKPALLDLSTIEDHNTQYFNFVDLPISALENFDVTVSKITTLMFNRFYTENIMHVLHDDLIPAFHTLLMIANGDTDAFKNIQLLLSDDLNDGDFFKLYKTLSNHEIFTRKSLREQKRNICFQDIHVGLSTATLWYQYGYRKPQGPLPNYKSAPGTIRKFTDFIKENLKPRQQGFMGHFMGNYFVLLSRKENRKIINEGDLIIGIANRFKIQVRTLSVDENKVSEIIDVLQSARGAVGMHGSLLSLAMFLPPGSVLVELFPYAVNPSDYTPYKTMATIPGVNLVYRFWRNRNKTRTYIHPDSVPEYGGIKHLPKEVQEKILQDIDVPPHLCCKDPHWLFRAYQDTRVNVKTVLKLIDSGKNESEKYMKTLAQKSVISYLHPGKVQSLLCKPALNEGTVSLTVSWDLPWNLKYFENNVDLKVKFEVWIQEVGMEKYKAWIVEARKHSFSELKQGVKHLIWVRAIVAEKIGPFNDAFICDGET